MVLNWSQNKIYWPWTNWPILESNLKTCVYIHNKLFKYLRRVNLHTIFFHLQYISKKKFKIFGKHLYTIWKICLRISKRTKQLKILSRNSNCTTFSRFLTMTYLVHLIHRHSHNNRHLSVHMELFLTHQDTEISSGHLAHI